MTRRISLAAAALALALPAAAQYSSSTTTTSSGGSTVQQNITSTPAGTTSITGGTGQGTVSSSGVVVDAQADRALLSRVVAALAAAPDLQGSQIDVQVVGGRVTLNGATPGISQAESARSIAQAIAGSANVASNLSTTRQ